MNTPTEFADRRWQRSCGELGGMFFFAACEHL